MQAASAPGAGKGISALKFRAERKKEGEIKMCYLNENQLSWCRAHEAETMDLLKALGKIPAPSHFEDQRAAFILAWLKTLGAEKAYIDEAKNVVLPIGVTENNPVNVIMAHTDIVFADTEELPMREEDGKLFAPGIGDDTANLAALLMAGKYWLEKKETPKEGLLIVANACEEGLGNLKGSKQILKDYQGRVQEFISLDGGVAHITNDAVGSCRMKITITAQGGHSYSKFGNTNAIVQMAELIGKLYEKEPPAKAKTTYNAGVIEGGSTVNSICGQCSLLYEYRSCDRECLQEMDAFFQETIDSFRKKGFDIRVEVLGVRPCKGDVDEEKLEALTKRHRDMLFAFTGDEPRVSASSTDANSALDLGIPAVTFGVIRGGGAHTRGEWIEMDCMPQAVQIALAEVSHYFA